MDRASYAIGFDMGRRLKADGIEANLDQMAEGLRTGFAGSDSRLTEDEMRQAMMDLQKQVTERMQAEQAQAAQANRAEGEAFLAENGKKDGITTLPSGLQYEVVTEGSGAKPTPQDRVTVHYTGTLIDGTKFDSSVDRGQPATFGVTQVIAGWTEALQLMSPGAKWRLYIPSDLAYGERGGQPRGNQPSIIGPNATLIFDVELIEIAK